MTLSFVRNVGTDSIPRMSKNLECRLDAGTKIDSDGDNGQVLGVNDGKDVTTATRLHQFIELEKLLDRKSMVGAW